jgi:hypothetical protein
MPETAKSSPDMVTVGRDQSSRHDNPISRHGGRHRLAGARFTRRTARRRSSAYIRSSRNPDGVPRVARTP